MNASDPTSSGPARVRRGLALLARPRALRAELQARRHRRSLAAPRLIAAFAETHPQAFFIVIGSNDGDQHDHLRDAIRGRRWSGIMVEPVPYVFERLRRNYGDAERIALENVAIADRDGELPFYHLRRATDEERAALPEWYDAIGSFSREAVLAHREHIPDIEERLVTIQAPTLTFESLCRKHDVDAPDLLLIDTEGYDYEIIKRVDLAARGPRLLVYEHYHLPAAERASCRELLGQAGYETMTEGFDTFCLRPEHGDALTRAWRELRPGVPELAADMAPAAS